MNIQPPNKSGTLQSTSTSVGAQEMQGVDSKNRALGSTTFVDLTSVLSRDKSTINSRVIETIKIDSQLLKVLLNQTSQNTPLNTQLRQLTQNFDQTSSPTAEATSVLAKLLLSASSKTMHRNHTWVLIEQALAAKGNLTLSVRNGEIFVKPNETQNHRSHANRAAENQNSTNVITQAQNRSGSLSGRDRPLPANARDTLSAALRNYLPQSQLPQSQLTQNQSVQISRSKAENTLTQISSLQTAPNHRAERSAITNFLSGDATPSAEVSALLRLSARSTSTTVKEIAHFIQRLNKISTEIIDLSKPTKVQSIQAAILNSGSLLENKLASIVKLANAQLSHINSQLSSSAQDDYLNQDLKAVLLHLQAISSQTGPLAQAKTENALVDAFVNILFSRTRNWKEQIEQATRKPSSRTDKLSMIEQFASSSIAHVTNHQLTSIQASLSDSLSQLFSCDILFKLFDSLLPVTLQVSWDESQADDVHTQPKRNWRFLIDWTFEETGRFNADIRLNQSLIDESKLTFTLWSENKDIMAAMQRKSKEFVDQLHNKDINVEQLNFSQHPLILNKLKHHEHNLVDIRT